MWDLLSCNLWSKVSAIISALFLVVSCLPSSLASAVLSDGRMTAYFWRHVCRINSFNNMLVNSWQRSFLFLFLVLFPFHAEAEQFISFCNVVHSSFKGKCHIPARVSQYWCLMFYQYKGKVAKTFFRLCSTLLAHLFTSLFSLFPAHYNIAYTGGEDFHGSNFLLPKPCALTVKQPILLPDGPEGRIYSFIFFVAFDTIKIAEIKIIFLHLNHRISDWLRLEGTSGGQAGPSRVISQDHIQTAFECLQGWRQPLSATRASARSPSQYILPVGSILSGIVFIPYIPSLFL